MDNYEVSREYLKQIEDLCSRTLVGKVCKRFEIIEDKELLKKEIKELIYESFRGFKELVEAYSTGVKFISRPKD